MRKFNAIVVDGKVYEAIADGKACKECDLQKMCKSRDEDYAVVLCHGTFDGTYSFRYSQTLTDKLNDK